MLDNWLLIRRCVTNACHVYTFVSFWISVSSRNCLIRICRRVKHWVLQINWFDRCKSRGKNHMHLSIFGISFSALSRCEWPQPIGNCLKTRRQCKQLHKPYEKNFVFFLLSVRMIKLLYFNAGRHWIGGDELLFIHRKWWFFSGFDPFHWNIFGIDFATEPEREKIILNKMSIESHVIFVSFSFYSKIMHSLGSVCGFFCFSIPFLVNLNKKFNGKMANGLFIFFHSWAHLHNKIC